MSEYINTGAYLRILYDDFALQHWNINLRKEAFPDVVAVTWLDTT
jgi:hypothetical protein